MHQPHVAQPVTVYKPNAITQSPHSSSLWVFALSAVESYRPLPPVPTSHLGTKLSSMVLLLFGLRVISICELPSILIDVLDSK